MEFFAWYLANAYHGVVTLTPLLSMGALVLAAVLMTSENGGWDAPESEDTKEQ